MRNMHEIAIDVIAAIGEAFKHGEMESSAIGPLDDWVSCAFTLPDDLVPEKVEIPDDKRQPILLITTKEGLRYSISVGIWDWDDKKQETKDDDS